MFRFYYRFVYRLRINSLKERQLAKLQAIKAKNNQEMERCKIMPFPQSISTAISIAIQLKNDAISVLSEYIASRNALIEEYQEKTGDTDYQFSNYTVDEVLKVEP